MNGVNSIIQKISVPNAEVLKKISFELRNEVENLFAVLAADVDGSPQISVIIADNLVVDKGLNAGNLVREFAKAIKGGGGGQPFFATAGGKDLSGLDQVISEAKAKVESFD
jgi:alanyl-tRNA synthetase